MLGEEITEDQIAEYSLKRMEQDEMTPATLRRELAILKRMLGRSWSLFDHLLRTTRRQTTAVTKTSQAPSSNPAASPTSAIADATNRPTPTTTNAPRNRSWKGTGFGSLAACTGDEGRADVSPAARRGPTPCLRRAL